MSIRRMRIAATLAMAGIALVLSTARAHEFKLEALMNSFVKIEANEAHLLIRVPLYLFKSVRFPVKGAKSMSRNQAMQWNAPLLCAMIPALALVRRYVLVGRVGTIILSAIVAHTGWHWMGERWDALSKLAWPSPDWDAVVVAARWIAVLLVAGGIIGYVAKRLRFEATSESAARVIAT